MKAKQLESDLKAIVIEQLINQNLLTSEDTIINELNLGDFSRRVDLAVIRKNKIYAYEIKSEGDSLTRLKPQVEKYLEYFDKVTVITAPKHTSKALQMTPGNVGIWEISASTISIIRKGKLSTKIDKLKFIDFMTVADLIKFAKSEGIALSNYKRSSLEQTLIYQPSSKLRQHAIEALKRRYLESSEKFLSNISHSQSIQMNDLLHLKRRKKIISNEESTFDINSCVAFLDKFKKEKLDIA